MRKFKVLLSVLATSFIIVGCGGGGSSGGSTIPESDKVVITEENSEQVISGVVNSISISDYFENGPVPLYKSSGSVQDESTQHSIEMPVLKAVSISKNLKVSGSEQCAQGGTLSYDGGETGGTIIFNNCREYGVTINGTVSVTSNTAATYMTMTFTNLSMIEDANNKIVFNSASATVNFDSYGEITDMTMSVTGYSVVYGERTDLENYRVTIAEDSNYNATITLNGSIRTDCIGGWVTVSTITPIYEKANDDCPSSGRVVINGNASSLTLDFNADGSVDVSGSFTNHYESCDDLDTGACSI